MSKRVRASDHRPQPHQGPYEPKALSSEVPRAWAHLTACVALCALGDLLAFYALGAKDLAADEATS
jgi:hypothetical protein